MRKSLKACCLFAALLVGGSVYAQTTTTGVSDDKYRVETNRFWNNWFISVGGGGQIYFGEDDSKASFGDRIAPALDVAVGKWFTPSLGLRFEYSGLQAKGAIKPVNGTTTNPFAKDGLNDKGYFKQKWNIGHFHGDVMFNFSNMFCGYSNTRVWNFIPYIGFGDLHSWTKSNNGNGSTKHIDELTASLGLLNTWRLGDALTLNLDVRASMCKTRFDYEEGGKAEDGLLAATLGLTYKFKQRGWEKSEMRTVSTGISEEDMNAVREKLNNMASDNERLQNELNNARNAKGETVYQKEYSVAPCIVTFPIGKSSLSKTDRVNLGYFAKVIKNAGSDKTYTIVGYADKKTGTNAINEKLSKARAQAVYNTLTKEFGVNASQLKMDYKGGVDNMFYNDAALSRAVIMSDAK